MLFSQKAESSLNLSNTVTERVDYIATIAKVKTTFCLCENSTYAFGYLVKPLRLKEVHHQLNEALSYMKEDKEELVEFITNEGLVRINLNKIYYFEYQSRKVLMKTNDKIYILKEKISDISSRMRSHGFEMPHKSFVVNLYNVKSIKGYDIFMMDESVIPLSQKKSTEFRKTLNIYLSNHIEKNIRG